MEGKNEPSLTRAALELPLRQHLFWWRFTSGGARARGHLGISRALICRGLEMCRGLEVVAQAARSGGFCRSKSRLFQLFEAGAF